MRRWIHSPRLRQPELHRVDGPPRRARVERRDWLRVRPGTDGALAGLLLERGPGRSRCYMLGCLNAPPGNALLPLYRPVDGLELLAPEQQAKAIGLDGGRPVLRASTAAP